MKSIANQYRDLKEGRMSQANFMRNLRMAFPQYVTNITSFGDAVQILKNKSIITEAESWLSPDPPTEETFRDAVEEMLERMYYKELKDINLFNRVEDLLSDAKYLKDLEFKARMSAYEGAKQVMKDASTNAEYEDENEDEFDALLKKYGEEEEEKYTKFTDISEAEEIKIKGKVVKNYKQNGDKSYSVEFEDGTKDKIYVNQDEWDTIHDADKEKLNEAKKKKAKKEEKPYNPNAIHPQELRMGIKVEMEHTDDPKKAEKIALDHLAENPFYYTALKLSGVESPSAPKVKAPKEAPKKAKKKDATEMVDKDNQMQKVKMVKEDYDYTRRSDDIEGEDYSNEIKDELENRFENGAIDQETLNAALDFVDDNGYDLYSDNLGADYVLKQVIKSKNVPGSSVPMSSQTQDKVGDFLSQFRSKGVDPNDFFRNKLKEVVREVIAEYYDGGPKDLAAMAKGSDALRYKPETQAIAKKAAENANSKEKAASLAIKLAKAKGITDSEQITHIVDLAASKFMNETFDGRDNLDAENEY